MKIKKENQSFCEYLELTSGHLTPGVNFGRKIKKET
jgi:hypothetical protein